MGFCSISGEASASKGFCAPPPPEDALAAVVMRLSEDSVSFLRPTNVWSSLVCQDQAGWRAGEWTRTQEGESVQKLSNAATRRVASQEGSIDAGVMPEG